MIRHVLKSTFVCCVIATAYGQEFDLSWQSIDSGGVIKSTGGVFDLSGTIGQPDAGTMSGGFLN